MPQGPWKGVLAFSGRPAALIPRDGMGQAKPSPLASGVGYEGSIAGILAQPERPVEVGKDEGSHLSRPEVGLVFVGTRCSSSWVWHRLCLMHCLPVGWEPVGTPNLVCGSRTAPGYGTQLS